MPKMIHRAATRVATTLGHVLRFEPNKALDVPQAAVEAALHFGARMVDDAKVTQTEKGEEVALKDEDAVQYEEKSTPTRRGPRRST